ncbi:class I SAM-dependent methyltransferase [Brytella acorum]|uniref:Methyltransferase n=1 Tax=Brytella acorum TaxID=2959299 RepID=A0AA35Y2Q8_9PROT|nr:methyltransferase [Brytella acorum]MDF3625644.1 methyltransferase [Brytella acorum]CAI9119509.1 methyltransferase [Brytella acorum]
MTTRRSILTLAALAGLGIGVMQGASAQTVVPLARRNTGVGIAAALSNRDRPEADRTLDATRKPAGLLAFAGVKRGMNIADIMPGHGYFTRIFSNAVGKDGHVWAVNSQEHVAHHPKAADPINEIAADPAFDNVTSVVQPLNAITLPKPLDLAWTSQNYHDVYYGAGPDAALAFDRSVFTALRKGGVFMVIDHVGTPGTNPADAARLHRIDPALIRQQLESVGFQFEGESKLLANPQDRHDVPVFDPSVRGHTDQVVLKFRKP